KFAQRRDRRRLGLVPAGRVLVVASQFGGDRRQRCLHVVHAGTVGDASDQRPVAAAPFGTEWRRVPDPDRRTWTPESARHHADDRSRLAAETKLTADDRRLAAEFLPQPVADDA